MQVKPNTSPFLKLLLGLIIGIGLRRFVPIEIPVIPILIVISLALIATLVLYRRLSLYRRQYVYGIFLMLWLIAFGWLLTENFYQKHTALHGTENAVYLFVVDRYAIERSNSYLINGTLGGELQGDILKPMNDRVMLYFGKDSSAAALEPGDSLLLESCVALPPVQTGTDGFNYGRFLYEQGIMGTGYVATARWKKVGQSRAFNLRWIGERCRYALMQRLKQTGLHGEAYDIVGAMALGYRDELTPEVKSMYRNSGASHILAVSGLHVGILYVLLLGILSFLKPYKWGCWVSFCVIVLVLWCYAWLTGLSPSVCRATFMCTFLSLAMVLERTYLSVNALCGAAFFWLIIDPLSLFQASFLLSYGAVAAILILLHKILALWRPKNGLVRWIWNLVAVSFAAQLGTLPFVLFFFHQWPLYGLLSTFIVIPMATLVLYGTLFTLLFGTLPVIGTWITLLLEGVVKGCHYLLQLCASLPGAVVDVWIEWWQMLLVLVVLITLFALVFKFTYSRLVVLLVLVIGLSLSFMGQTVYYKRQPQQVVVEQSVLRVYGNDVLLVGGAHNSWSRQGSELVALKRRLSTIQELNDSTSAYYPFTCSGNTYLLLRDKPLAYKLCSTPLEIDVLILGRGIYPNSRLFDCFIHPKTVVLLDEVSKYYLPEFQVLCSDRNIYLHSIRKQGVWKNSENMERVDGM